MSTLTHPHWRKDAAVLNAARNSPAFKLGSSSGSGVMRLREALVLVGAPTIGEAPTQFGPLTHAQVKAFQALYAMDADGIAGSGSLAKLDELLFAPLKRKPWPSATPADVGHEAFLQKVAAACGPTARAAGLPVSGMLACAAVESGWGTGAIYRETNNLFSLQKWPWVLYPRTERTAWRDTVIQTNPRKTAKAPFNTARDLQDAARQWCEWIQYYGTMQGPPGSVNKNQPQKADNPHACANRQRLMRMASEPLRFARNLYLVGFGESLAHGELYARVLVQYSLTRFD
jgi:peptidoglycan hydrolase-like protein with peptidoglycan-binding domain